MSTILLDVTIGGRNVTSILSPIVQSVKTFDGTDNEADSADIVLADNDGRTFLANAQDPVSISLGRSEIGIGLVFEGFVDEPRSKGSREGGRTLAITCKSVDLSGKAKETGEKYWDDKPLGDVLKDAFSDTGISLLVDPSFASIQRAFESMDGRDPLTFAADIAREVGATFKTMGSRAVFAQRNSGLALTGAALATFDATWGDNLLSWDITPIIPRSSYSQAIGRWFDFRKGEWKEELETLSGQASLLNTIQRADQTHAKDASQSGKAGAERDAGAGTISVKGDFRAQAGGRCRVSGTRPGADGTYIISSVEHNASVSDGFTTRIELKHPQDGAGVDSR